MYHIVARISDHAVIETSSRVNLVIDDYLASIATNHGGVASDYTVYSLNDNDPVVARIRNGDTWTTVWTGPAITGIDFGSYDILDKIRFNSDKDEILANGIETCKITVRLINAADADIAPDVAGVYIPVQSPSGVVLKKVNIVAGLVRFDFGTLTPGEWKFPANGVKKILTYRVKNQQTVNALLV